MNQIHCATCERDVTTSEVNLVGAEYVDYYGHDVYFMPATPDIDRDIVHELHTANPTTISGLQTEEFTRSTQVDPT